MDIQIDRLMEFAFCNFIAMVHSPTPVNSSIFCSGECILFTLPHQPVKYNVHDDCQEVQ